MTLLIPLHHRSLPLLFIMALSTARSEVSSINVYVNADAVYRINHDQISIVDSEPRFNQLSLTERGHKITFWVNDDGDGVWENGESIDFIGHHARAKDQWFDPVSLTNVYQLTLDKPGQIGQDVTLTTEVQPLKPANPLAQQHLEQNLIRAPLTDADADLSVVSWYWHKLRANAQSPTHVPFELDSISTKAHKTIIRLKLRGWSVISDKSDHEFDHLLKVQLNGNDVGTVRWNGKTEYVAEFTVDSGWLLATHNEFTFTVLKRNNTDKHIIDIIYLDWIELTYQHSGQLAAYTELKAFSDQQITLQSQHPGFLYLANSKRQSIRSTNSFTNLQVGSKEDQEIQFVYTPEHQIRQVLGVKQSNQLSLKNIKADYLIVTHPAFMDGLAPLVQWHQHQGRSVLLWDTHAIYDTFDHGRFGAHAIKQAIQFVVNNSSLKLKHVLLVGDASWFGHNDLQPYASDLPKQLHNNLLPTTPLYSQYGPAASDVSYTLADDTSAHHIAVGRFPVNNHEQLDAMVKKTLSHHQNLKKGRWQSDINMLTMSKHNFQRKNQRIMSGLMDNKSSINLLLKDPDEVLNGSQKIVDAFNQGQSLIHFYGHGGRYMWQIGESPETGLPILFNREHIQQLRNEKLPVILSMTCSSAPFDHPSSNSFGELMLVTPKYGAVAVIGSSTRNNPPVKFSQTLINSLLLEKTIGEALNQARNNSPSQHYTDTYVLLGDPAIQLNLPDFAVTFETVDQQITAAVPSASFRGVFEVQQFNAANELIQQKQFESNNNQHQFRIVPEASSIRVYAYDALNREDAYGHLELYE